VEWCAHVWEAARACSFAWGRRPESSTVRRVSPVFLLGAPRPERAAPLRQPASRAAALQGGGAERGEGRGRAGGGRAGGRIREVLRVFDRSKGSRKAHGGALGACSGAGEVRAIPSRAGRGPRRSLHPPCQGAGRRARPLSVRRPCPLGRRVRLVPGRSPCCCPSSAGCRCSRGCCRPHPRRSSRRSR
jgi:hypothetical protein